MHSAYAIVSSPVSGEHEVVGMELLTPQQVPMRHTDQAYRESAAARLVAAVLMFGGSAGMFVWYWLGELPLSIACFSGAGLAFIGLVAFALFWKALSPDNWLLRVGDDGIYIKFRSHLNRALPSNDPQVVRLPVSEIESVRITKHRVTTEGSKGGTQVERLKHLDLRVAIDALEELSERLKYERAVKAKTKFHHYPVSVHGNTIRLLWRSARTTVTPSLAHAVAALSQQRIRVEPEQSEEYDYTARRAADREETDSKIMELLERGDRMGAIRLVQRAYNYGTTEAVAFVDSLLEQDGGGDGPES